MEQTTDLDFSVALAALKAGKSVARAGWNGKGMFVTLQVPDENSKMTVPYIFMTCPPGSTNQFGEVGKTSTHRIPWLVSQTDLMAADWEIVG